MFDEHHGFRFDGCGYDEWILRECPMQYVSGDIWQLMSLAKLYEKGLPPVIGGSLDQAVIFVAAAEFVWNQERQYKAEQWPGTT